MTIANPVLTAYAARQMSLGARANRLNEIMTGLNVQITQAARAGKRVLDTAMLRARDNVPLDRDHPLLDEVIASLHEQGYTTVTNEAKTGYEVRW